MVTPANCPQCGADLQPGAEICTACGHRLTESELVTPPEPPTATPEPPPPPPPTFRAAEPAPSTSKPAGSSFDAAATMSEFRSRWGVEQTPVLTAALLLVALAVVVGTYAVISYLIAGDNDFEQRSDARTLFFLALPAAFGAAGLLTYVRLEAERLTGTAHRQDQTIFLAIIGLSLVFTLLSLFKGLDEGLDAEAAWYYYSLLFAFFAIGFATLARPTPEALGGLASPLIGFAAIGIGLALAAIGVIQARSNTFSTYAMGVSLLDAGFVLVVLSLAWFLGMRKAVSRM